MMVEISLQSVKVISSDLFPDQADSCIPSFMLWASLYCMQQDGRELLQEGTWRCMQDFLICAILSSTNSIVHWGSCMRVLPH